MACRVECQGADQCMAAALSKWDLAEVERLRPSTKYEDLANRADYFPK